MTAVLRYGTAALSYSRHVSTVWSDGFRRIYGLQDANVSYSSPEAMLRDLGLYEFTQTSCEQYMKVGRQYLGNSST